MKLSAIILILIATSIWGLGFVATHWTLAELNPTQSQAMRFIIAGLISLFLLLIFKRPLFSKYSILAGLLLYVAMQVQTMGVALTTVTNSGFFTALYALFTPLLTPLFTSKSVPKNHFIWVFTALIGIYFLGQGNQFSFYGALNGGDFLVIASALFLSLHIWAVDYVIKKVFQKNSSDGDSIAKEALLFNLQQCLVMGLVGLIILISPWQNFSWQQVIHFSEQTIWSFVILSFFSSIIAFGIQVFAQSKVPPHLASLLFLTESLFAALFGYLLLGELLSVYGMIGSLILLFSAAGALTYKPTA